MEHRFDILGFIQAVYQQIPTVKFRCSSRIDYEKVHKMEVAVDGIRRRYGADSIKRACFLPESDREWIDHMGGGVSREKRTVDYSREKVL